MKNRCLSVGDHPRRGRRMHPRAMHRAHWPRDERRVAEIARRMRARGDFIVNRKVATRAPKSARCGRLIGPSRALMDDADSRRLAHFEIRLPAARYGGAEVGLEETRGTDRCSSLEWSANLRTSSAPRVALAVPFDLLADAPELFTAAAGRIFARA